MITIELKNIKQKHTDYDLIHNIQDSLRKHVKIKKEVIMILNNTSFNTNTLKTKIKKYFYKVSIQDIDQNTIKCDFGGIQLW